MTRLSVFVMRLTLVALLLIVSMGCNRSSDEESGPQPQAGGRTAQVELIVQRLEEMRSGATRTPTTDPSIVERIDAAMASLQDSDGSEIADAPFLISAFVSEDPFTMGADLLRIYGIISSVPGVAVIEVVGSDGQVVGIAETWVTAWDVEDQVGHIGTATFVLYLSPSLFDDPDDDVAPEVKHGQIRGDDGESYEVVTLPPDWQEKQLSVRVETEIGTRSNLVPMWILRR